MISVSTVVKVGIADMNIADNGISIRTSGLGSCIGVVLYDEFIKLAGMVHIMLPDSSIGKEAKPNLAKYADTGVEELIRQLTGRGASLRRLRCKMAGGAQMFQFQSKSDVMRIGPRNADAVKAVLLKNGIPIMAEDIGGNKGRTIEFFTSTGLLQVRTVNEGIKEI
ncbi:chemotaxis protein CheD [Bacillus sp. KH172YL63]|uniref:chemotaxis protein CheD n=1 Tax=Bacillus sp. KH172YL63 TaxID=2709784 RepID=UPI0013E50679|nr:chemotaxis protein CheD [Bacillus sp. KH172YL63]BCB03379.1 chemoreceptor glutamine deamidase CheD [Bacillus sp. KH172YL63]